MLPLVLFGHARLDARDMSEMWSSEMGKGADTSESALRRRCIPVFVAIVSYLVAYG